MLTKLRIFFVVIYLFFITGTALAAPFFPLRVGTQATFSGTDSLGNSWVSTFDVVGTATYNSEDYFHLQQYNYENSGDTEDIYLRVTDTQLFMYDSGLGVEELNAQTGTVGTQWNYPVGAGNYMYYEITSIGSVSVPYGTFTTTYGITHCQGNSGAGGAVPSACNTPTCIDYFAPGVGYIKEVDSWNNNNPPDTEVLSSSSNHSLYANFGSDGLWQWDGTTWTQANAVVPTSMVASGSVLYGDFGSGGLWQWDGTTWSQVNAVAPTSMVVSGSLLYANFTGGGLWQWDGTTWSQVNAVAPTSMVVSGSLLYANFTGGGLWQWDGTTWSQVNAVAPTSMVAGP